MRTYSDVFWSSFCFPPSPLLSLILLWPGERFSWLSTLSPVTEMFSFLYMWGWGACGKHEASKLDLVGVFRTWGTVGLKLRKSVLESLVFLEANFCISQNEGVPEASATGLRVLTPLIEVGKPVTGSKCGHLSGGKARQRLTSGHLGF